MNTHSSGFKPACLAAISNISVPFLVHLTAAEIISGLNRFTKLYSLKITFTQQMVAWTTENPLNYYISDATSATSLIYSKDTLVIHIGGLFSQNATYKMSVKHLLSKNMAFLSDTAISFFYPYKVEQKPLLAWTFDNLQNTSTEIFADYHLLDTVSEAVIFCNGKHKSSEWLSGELNVFNGTVLGDPRPKPIAGKAIAFVSKVFNNKTVVLKFPTKGYFNLALSLAVQRTNTGFNKHEWEWSLDGENYTAIENTATCPLTAGSFFLTTLDLRNIEELDDKEEVFLRLTFFGATGTSGNNRLDNITVHGVSILGNQIDTQKKSNNRFLIAPNPNRGEFIIIYDNSLFDSNTNYFIYNTFGQEIKRGNLNNPHIDLSNQSNGIYYCKIFDECLKIIKY